MLSAVIAIPVNTQKSPPEFLDDGLWENMALSRLSKSGAPGSSVVALLRDEFPAPIKFTLDRHSRSYWENPVYISDKVAVVAFEYLNTRHESPFSLLLCHLQADDSHSSQQIISNLTRLLTKNFSDMIKNFFAAEQCIVSQSRGIGVATVAQVEPMSGIEWKNWDNVIALETNADLSDMICHGRFAHILTVVALQQFNLNSLENIWPSSVSKVADFYKFREQFHTFRHECEWAEICTHELSQSLYHKLLERLGIPNKISEYSNELRDFFIAAEADSARSLNKYGFIVALLATVPTWLTANWSRQAATTGVVGICGTMALVGLGSIVFKRLKR